MARRVTYVALRLAVIAALALSCECTTDNTSNGEDSSDGNNPSWFSGMFSTATYWPGSAGVIDIESDEDASDCAAVEGQVDRQHTAPAEDAIDCAAVEGQADRQHVASAEDANANDCPAVEGQVDRQHFASTEDAAAEGQADRQHQDRALVLAHQLFVDGQLEAKKKGRSEMMWYVFAGLMHEHCC